MNLKGDFLLKKKSITIGCVLSAIALSGAISFFFLAKKPVCNEKENYPIKRTIQYSFTLKNKKNRVVENAKFWAFAPVSRTSFQKCIKIEASYPFELITDDFGNQSLIFSIEQLAPFATRIISIKAVLLLSDFPNCLEEEVSRYLASEAFVESNATEIVHLANNATGGTVGETAENVFNWVAGNIQYAGFQSEERGALKTLISGKGDCTEFMRLFVALCRANEIPSRSVGGYVCRGNTVLKPVGYHNWAEFYMEGGWHLSDPQKKNFMENASEYIAMQIISESPENAMNGFRRFRFEGDGLEVKMNS